MGVIAALAATISLLASCVGQPAGRREPSPGQTTQRPPPSASETPAVGSLSEIPEGWTELPEPPEIRHGSSAVWAGDELIDWGGYVELPKDRYRYVADGFAFDPASRTWRAIPPAPSARGYARPVSIRSEILFLFGRDKHREFSDGLAFDPAAETWRELAKAPIEPGAVTAWTGDEVFVWGGGRVSAGRATEGAAYDPETDTWRRVADAPAGLNLASGLWTGDEVLVFGSLLNNRNHATTPTSVGFAYDPARDAWRGLPPSALSPQATTAVWVEGRMVAWDYETTAQEYFPRKDAWGPPVQMPIEPSECYPDSVVVGDRVFAWFCGRVAEYDPHEGGWRKVDGGISDVTIDVYGNPLPVYRFADLVPAGDAVFLEAVGITVNKKGTPCYGCDGSPTALWVYRTPASFPAPAPADGPPPRKTAKDLVSDFMWARISGAEGKMQWLLSPRAVSRFEDAARGVPEPLYSGTSYNYGDDALQPVKGRPGVYAVTMTLFFRGRHEGPFGSELPEEIIVGPGRTLGGSRADLVVIGVRPA